MAKRILLTDVLFPNKYAQWRLVEILSFIEYFDTDILVIQRVDAYCQNIFNFDYEQLKEKFKLDQYDLLIFNKKYNNYNKYNVDFDGTQFNGKLNADYMFRKKTHRNEDFLLTHYDLVYHIFLMNYNLFKRCINSKQVKQMIHLYPGGGLSTSADLLSIDAGVKLVVSQHFINNFILNAKLPNTTLNVFCGPFFYKNQEIKTKTKRMDALNICFTSLGPFTYKGGNVYIQIKTLYKERYKHGINFYCIVSPNIPLPADIIRVAPMEQCELSKFYHKNIDILINADTNMALNGFPLGCEAMSEGVVLFTTDYYDSNKLNNFNYGDEMYIINIHKIDDIVNNINTLHNNRDMLHHKSIQIQKKTYELFNYDNTMAEIFNFINM